MKSIGIVLILAALGVGSFLLSDTIPGYKHDKNLLARHRAEAQQVEKRLASLRDSASEADISRAIRDAELSVQQLRFDQEMVERRRNESLIVGGGSLAVLALGAFLFARGRRKRSPAGGIAVVPA